MAHVLSAAGTNWWAYSARLPCSSSILSDLQEQRSSRFWPEISVTREAVPTRSEEAGWGPLYCLTTGRMTPQSNAPG
jgi:hypothetical protein